MAAFEYQALDAAGRATRGISQGDSSRQVRARLREQGLVPLTVEAVTERPGAQMRVRSRRRRLNQTDLTLVTRQLATLLSAGLTLEEALTACVDQIERPAARRVLAALRARVIEGHSLSQALAEFPGSFPEMYRATIAAGEQSGRLDHVMERLADYTESRQSLSRRTAMSLLYPGILTLAALAVVGVMLGYVVPQITQVFERLDTGLPWPTRMLLAVSGFLDQFGVWLVLLIAACVLGFVLALRYAAVRYRFDAFVLKLPLIGRLVRSTQGARFARTLSILAGSGVPVLESLRISANVVGNLPMRRAIVDAARQVREGASLNRALKASRQFPPTMLQLITSGERSGRLEQMLARAADNMEREVDTLLAGFMGILEPALILIVGVLVLFIVLAILLPIFELNQLVK